MGTTEITAEQAIAELRQPTGDAHADEVREGLAENIERGYVEPTGRDDSGEIRVRMTAAGKAYVESMGT